MTKGMGDKVNNPTHRARMERTRVILDIFEGSPSD